MGQQCIHLHRFGRVGGIQLLHPVGEIDECVLQSDLRCGGSVKQQIAASGEGRTARNIAHRLVADRIIRLAQNRDSED
ncbi:MAG: hypothetical protein EBT40_00565 [Betaproteobacteria bacterium]|nr:hypothetical protein [Betaproteobacteria bacterium]